MAVIQLPQRLGLAEVPGLWRELEPQFKAGACEIDASALSDFDSGALTLLLSAARTARAQGQTLQVRGMPTKLQELARVYGVEALLAQAA